MLVVVRAVPGEIDPAVSTRVTGDVTAGLQAVVTSGARFIVNDTLWYGMSRKGKITAQVVNSAGFISKTIQNYLHTQKGWEKEKTLARQTIDAYIALQSRAGFQLDRSQLGSFLDQYTTVHPEASVDDLFFRYVKRGCFNLSGLDPSFHASFQQGTGTVPLHVGLEFETGNIASSFRSLNKLNFLFREGEIDAGVFITSADKGTTAARIWPKSNRNGSFEELERRNYRETISFPVWEFSFAPDDISRSAPYLGVNGTTYEPVGTGRRQTIGGRTFEIWTGDGKELWRPT